MKTLFIIIGTISLLLGVVGIVVPLLPTTPFLLLSAALYLYSSPRLYAWLISSKYLGEYIRRYNEDRAIPRRVKVYILIVLWASMGYGCWCVATGVLWLQILLLAIGFGVTWHILSLKTRNK